MRAVLFIIVMAVVALAAFTARPSRAHDVVGTYGRWQLERGVLPDRSGAFHTLRSAELTGEPSRLALSCGSDRQVPYFSHALMATMTGERETSVVLGADGQDAVETTMLPLGTLAFLGDRGQHDRILALMRRAEDVVTLRVRERTFVFTASGLNAGAAELDRQCPSRPTALR